VGLRAHVCPAVGKSRLSLWPWNAFLSNSRTAGFALAGSLFLLVLVGLARGVVDSRLVWQRLAPVVAILILLLFIIDTAGEGNLRRVALTFINKGGTRVTSVFASREAKFSEAYQAFRTHCWAGIGFGMNISRSDPFQVRIHPLLGIPLSAPVEAGVMYMALPAQIGIIGLLPFLLFLLAFARPIARYAPLPILGLAVSALLTNAGEYTFFSMGGWGLYLWLYFAFAHRYSAECGSVHDT